MRFSIDSLRDAKRLNELAGILLILLGLVSLLALLSYSHTDLTWFKRQPQDVPTQNWIGRVGATLAEAYLQIVGAAAFTLPFLLGLAGCTSMDVVSILLKKRAPLRAFRLEVDASRAEEHPKVFTAIHLTFYLEGEGLKEKDVIEAIRLSQEKYCSASVMFSKTCEITYEYKIE